MQDEWLLTWRIGDDSGCEYVEETFYEEEKAIKKFEELCQSDGKNVVWNIKLSKLIKYCAAAI